MQVCMTRQFQSGKNEERQAAGEQGKACGVGDAFGASGACNAGVRRQVAAGERHVAVTAAGERGKAGGVDDAIGASGASNADEWRRVAAGERDVAVTAVGERGKAGGLDDAIGASALWDKTRSF